MSSPSAETASDSSRTSAACSQTMAKQSACSGCNRFAAMSAGACFFQKAYATGFCRMKSGGWTFGCFFSDEPEGLRYIVFRRRLDSLL